MGIITIAFVVCASSPEFAFENLLIPEGFSKQLILPNHK